MLLYLKAKGREPGQATQTAWRAVVPSLDVKTLLRWVLSAAGPQALWAVEGGSLRVTVPQTDSRGRE